MMQENRLHLDDRWRHVSIYMDHQQRSEVDEQLQASAMILNCFRSFFFKFRYLS